MKGLELEREREEETDREGIERHERAGTERSQGREEEPGALSAQGQKLFLDDHTGTRGPRTRPCATCQRAVITSHVRHARGRDGSLTLMWRRRENIAPKKKKKGKNNPKRPHLRK